MQNRAFPGQKRKLHIVKKIAHVSKIWLSVSRIVLAPLFYEITPSKCWFVCFFFYFVFFFAFTSSAGVRYQAKSNRKW